MTQKPQPLTDWSDDQVERFFELYHQWYREQPEVKKTGLARVALIYRLAWDAVVAPLQERLSGYVQEIDALNRELLAIKERLAGIESTSKLLAQTHPNQLTCPRCGSAMQVVEYTNRRRGRVKELRCSHRHSHARRSSAALDRDLRLLV